MSRKDTIIIALLINAGLLALLFMLAINTEEDKVSDVPGISQTLAESQIAPTSASNQMLPIAHTPTSMSPDADEVDSFLKELSSDELSQPILIDEDGYVEFVKESPTLAKPDQTHEIRSSDELQYVEVTIKRGDALEKIARSNGTTVEAIKKANNLTSNKLTVGKTLKIPLGKNSSPKISEAKPVPTIAENTSERRNATSTEPLYYTIKGGDNPWKIAKQYNVKFEDLLKLNGLNEEKARNLKVGDKVRVR